MADHLEIDKIESFSGQNPVQMYRNILFPNLYTKMVYLKASFCSEKIKTIILEMGMYDTLQKYFLYMILGNIIPGDILYLGKANYSGAKKAITWKIPNTLRSRKMVDNKVITLSFHEVHNTGKKSNNYVINIAQDRNLALIKQLGTHVTFYLLGGKSGERGCCS